MQRGRGPVDEVDREIIRLLQRDGRTSNTDIARALDVTETTIRKRIARLIDEDLVNVVAVPTPRAVGMTLSAIIGISVQLPNLQAVSERLVAYPEVRYVGIAAGRYDIIVESFFNDHGHLLEFVSGKLGALSRAWSGPGAGCGRPGRCAARSRSGRSAHGRRRPGRSRRPGRWPPWPP
jgi:Lrp/AsnC family transcriptional regulator for asnA, asnC and gidA